MKTVILTINLLISFSNNVFAGGLEGLRTVAQNIDAITTQDGEYARIQDLREGLVRFKGLKVTNNHIELLENNEIESLILENGDVINAVTGGPFNGSWNPYSLESLR